MKITGSKSKKLQTAKIVNHIFARVTSNNTNYKNASNNNYNLYEELEKNKQ